MHDHNNNDNKHGGRKGIAWMMILCLLLLGFIFLDGAKLFSGGYLWPILIGVFVVAHIWMMFKGHGGHADEDGDENPDTVDPAEEIAAKKNEYKHGGCCH